ncbi:O-antigen ligase [uncultured Arthrobacter sp.]|uniref:O-antigen ligase family protein n=1 Tax=uncultured Arthrobacter sp. TaxID=114050 RepID=UPI002603847E|nr:O-antigen ligase family protein [uncultured Arthrobacter sp.]
MKEPKFWSKQGVLFLAWVVLIATSSQPSPEKLAVVLHISASTVSIAFDLLKYLGICLILVLGAPPKWSLLWPSFIFIGLMAASVPFSVDIVHSALTVGMILVTLLVSIRTGFALSPKMLIGGAVVGLLAVLVPSLFFLRVGIYDPVTGVFGTRNEIARIATYCAILSVASLWASRSWGKLFAGMAFMFSTWFCWYTESATALTTLVAFLAVFLLVLKVGWPLSPLQVALSTFVVGIFLVVVPMSYRLFFTLTGRDITFTGRTDIWDYAWTSVAARPIFGYGAEAFWSSDGGRQGRTTLGDAAVHSHNTWIELYLSLGVIGGTLAILILGAQVLTLFRAIPSRLEGGKLVVAIFCGITAITVMYGFSEHAAYRPFYSLVFIYLALSISLTRVPR